MLRIVPCFGARPWQLSAFSFSNMRDWSTPMQMVGHFSSTFDETAPDWGNRPYLVGASRDRPRIPAGGLGVGPLQSAPKSPLGSENGRNPCTTARHNGRVTTYCRGVPIGAKKFSPIPTLTMIGIDFSEPSPKRTRAQNASFWTKCSIPVAREPPISLPSHSRFDTGCLGPERRWSKKIDTEARPSPGTARRCTGAFRAERVPLHQQDSEIGRIRAQFARSRAWSGRGGLHSPDFHPGGPRIFSTHYAQPCGKILGGEQKILPRCISPEYSRGSGIRVPVASENFFHHRGTKIVSSESISSAPYY